ncbi:MAG: DUF447 family protein [Gemmatimonadales bacterium]|nr:DUF447 family protein [Gemmatimonadales bacterium]
MIIECLVTTQDATGEVNVAPMGVEWGTETIVLKPFIETATFRNLQAVRAAVLNLTDDVLLFAEAATSRPSYPWSSALHVPGAVLEAACSWRELQVESIDATPPRARCVMRVVHRGLRREAILFNRARHAVLEAAILATRTHLLPPQQIRDDLARLQPLIEKTAGPREWQAWRLLEGVIHDRLGAASVAGALA